MGYESVSFCFWDGWLGVVDKSENFYQEKDMVDACYNYQSMVSLKFAGVRCTRLC